MTEVTYGNRAMRGYRLDDTLEFVQMPIDMLQLAVIECCPLEQLVGLKDKGAGGGDLSRFATRKINEAIVFETRIGVGELPPLRARLHG